MQWIETRWLVVHSTSRTVVVVQRWDKTFFCTCGGRSQCSHIRKVSAKVLGQAMPLAQQHRKAQPKFREIPEQLPMPLPIPFVGRKFR